MTKGTLLNYFRFLYNRYKKKLEKLIVTGCNLRKQDILQRRLVRLNSIIKKMGGLIKPIAAATLLTGGALLFQPNAAKSQCFQPGTKYAFPNVSAFPNVAFGDLDGDGDFDMVVGGNNDGGGYIRFYKNIGNKSTFQLSGTTDTSGIFQATPDMTFPNQILDHGYYNDYVGLQTPVLADLDGDGDLDLIVGVVNYYGNGLYYEKNIGTPTNPEFAAPVVSPFGLPYQDKVTFADMDGDGDLDAFIHITGNLDKYMYAQNIGSKTRPQFAPAIDNPFGINLTGAHNLAIADINGDGKQDIVLQSSPHNNANFSNPLDQYYYPGTGNAAKPFGEKIRLPIIQSKFATSLAVADLNNDGHADIISNVSINNFQSIPQIYTYEGAALFLHRDVDKDGYGEAIATALCDSVAGYVSNNKDCNDADSNLNIPPGDPNVFGQDVWKVSVFNEGNGLLNGTTWSNNYFGYYIDTSFSFNSENRWNRNNPPTTASGYQGCLISDPYYSNSNTYFNYSWTARRQGFNCGNYSITVYDHNQSAQLLINGDTVWQHEGCCDVHPNVWTGKLDANSKVEFRTTKGQYQFNSSNSSYSDGNISIVPAKPTITASSDTLFCAGQNIVLTASEGGNYLWSTGDTTRALTISDAGTYTVSEIICGDTLTSNAVTIFSRSLVKPDIVVNQCGSASVTNYPTNALYKFAWYRSGQADSVSNFYSVYPVVSGDYHAVVSRSGCFSAPSDTVSLKGSLYGDPAVFGNNVWNVYGWNSGAQADSGTSWNINYSGYYIDTTLNFNTQSRWPANASPSSASGWQGCNVDVDNHSWSAKRQGFPCGHYQVNIPSHDDEAQLFIDGIKVWEHIGCCDPHPNVWEGDLGPNSKVEFRGTEGGGGSLGAISFIPVAPAITAGGALNVCKGNSVLLTSSYDTGIQWYKNNVALIGETAQTYSATATGTYTVHLASQYGCDAVSQPVNVTVSETQTPGDPTVYGNNIWNVYGWNAGGTTDAGTSWKANYSGYYTDTTFNFNTQDRWNESASPSSAQGWQGCEIALDNHSWSAKRQGFPCGHYRISIPAHDDEAQLFINGVKVWDANCCDVAANVWEGDLGPTSKIDFRATEGVGYSFGAISFTLTPIIANGPTTFCPGFGIDLTAPAGTSYLWSNNSTGQTIHVADSGTYSVNVVLAVGCTETTSISTHVQSLVKPEISSFTGTSICNNGYSEFHVNNPINSLIYTVTPDSVDVLSRVQFSTPYAGTYTVTAKDQLGCTASSDISITGSAPGNFNVFGNNIWNVYAFSNNYAVSMPWQQNYLNGSTHVALYYGYYIDSGLSFDTRDRWDPIYSPSAASGYSGCNVNADYHAWSAKRKGFPCGHYQINIPGHDDDAELWINGVLVWQQSGRVININNVWQGYLGPNTSVEFRAREYGGDSFGAISFVLLDSNGAAKPVISPAGTSVICSADSLILTSSSTAGNVWNTGATTQSIKINASGTYSVTVTGSEGCSVQSDAAQVTVLSGQTYYQDSDHDGYGNLNVRKQACSQPAGYVSDNTDCDDTHASVHPGATELWDGLDNNCNGTIDEGFVTLSIADASATEGNKGKSSMAFTVSLSKASTKKVTVQFTTQNGTATAGSDYVTKSGTLNFKPGVTQQIITIALVTDKIAEPNETFTINLSSPTKATLERATGTGTILNDDGQRVSSAIAQTTSEAVERSVKIAPNPASSILNVDLSGYTGNITMQLVSLQGRVFKQEKIQAGTLKYMHHQVNVTDVLSGSYFLIVTDEKGNRQTEKVIIAR